MGNEVYKAWTWNVDVALRMNVDFKVDCIAALNEPTKFLKSHQVSWLGMQTINNHLIEVQRQQQFQ